MEESDLMGEDHADTVTSKIEHDRDATPSSMGSSPEDDAGGEQLTEPAQPQKRKGGRKPIYATSEERKQRNRQAQAAFRERRTEYIKQLEATIKQHEEALATLRESQRTAADECLMLRYKNSLLERILLEKGINVQAELQMKTGSPVLGPGFVSVPVPPLQSQLQRTAIQRQQARRSGGSSYLTKLAPGQTAPDMGYHTASPRHQPTPSSHASSPTQLSTQSPLAMHQGGMTPPTSAVHTQQHAQQFSPYTRPSQQPMPPSNNSAYFPQAQQSLPPLQRPPLTSHYQGSVGAVSTHSASSHQSLAHPAAGSSGNTSAAPASSASNNYPSPFQKHFDQLDQEYDTQQSHSMLDDPDGDDPAPNPSPQVQGSYASSQFDPTPAQPQEDFYRHPSELYAGRQQTTQHRYDQPTGLAHGNNHTGSTDAHYGVDPNDPLLDADPFGLSASMHYPTNYSFDQQHHGQR